LKKLIHIVGNRPQFVKLAVLYNQLASQTQIQQEILHTGQHFSYDMSELFFKELNIPTPNHNFNIQDSSANIFIAKASDALQQYFEQHKNCVALVYGDTNTTLAAAIAAKRAGINLIHFEAGVRTLDNTMPEEINRILTDRLANVNYCCTQLNTDTMLAEGYNASINTVVLNTGDLMLDAFLKINASPTNIIDTNDYVACTIHRSANLSSKDNLQNIITALNSINKNIPVIMPVHPHTQKKMTDYGLKPEFTLLPALGYPSMKTFLKNSSYVITDSGGTSREAYFSQKKSLIIMDQPFWPEIINDQCSINTIVSNNTIAVDFLKLDALKANFNNNIFGNGQAAQAIQQHLINYL